MQNIICFPPKSDQINLPLDEIMTWWSWKQHGKRTTCIGRCMHIIHCLFFPRQKNKHLSVWWTAVITLFTKAFVIILVPKHFNRLNFFLLAYYIARPIHLNYLQWSMYLTGQKANWKCSYLPAVIFIWSEYDYI